MENNKNRNIISILMLTFLLVISLFTSGCERAEQPHLYWKNIDVTVTNVDKRHWFAGTHHYEVTTYVHSDEYNLDGYYTERTSGAFDCPASWNYERGDTVKAELYTYVLDSTGKIIDRKINKIY